MTSIHNRNNSSGAKFFIRIIQFGIVLTILFFTYSGVSLLLSTELKSMLDMGNFLVNQKKIQNFTITVSLFFLTYIILIALLKSFTYLRDILNINLDDDESIEVKIKEKADHIHQLIFSSSFQYMESQYTAIFMIGILILGFLLYRDLPMGIGFAIGAIWSCFTGLFNMYLCTSANLRVTISANKSLKDAFNTAFKSGVSGSLFTLTASIICLCLTMIMGGAFHSTSLSFGTAFGCSFVCIFGRLAGGIFTKAADVGADLVGKVESELAEDDIRNPGVIADNVGDNVGDGHGMILDVFESFVVTMIMMTVWAANKTIPINIQNYLMVNSTLLCAFSLIVTYFAKYFMALGKSVWSKLQLYCYGAIGTIALLSIISFIGTYKIFSVPINYVIGTISCITIGFLVSVGILKSTEYYTSSKYAPVKKLAKSATSGHGTNIIYGLSIYYLCIAIPLIMISIGVLISYNLMGIMGIMLTAMAMISITGPVVTLDLIGPITDNAGGIGEMSGMSEEVRDNTDHLDAVGNITKAMTKGFSIGAATFTAIATNMLFVQEVWHLKQVKIICSIINPYIFIGLIIGAIVTSIFCGLAMRSVGEAANAIVLNVREQFQKKPGILDGTEVPDYMSSIAYLTKVSIKKMVLPALLPILVPIGSFFLYKYFIGMDLIYDFLLAISMGNTLFGIITSISMTTAGGAWDNSKKYIEEGHFGGKGSEAHKCAVTGDTVGDPLKDTAGPALNVLIKIMGIIISLFIVLYK